MDRFNIDRSQVRPVFNLVSLSFLILISAGCYNGLPDGSLDGRYHPIDPDANEVNFLVYGDPGTGGTQQYQVGRAMKTVCDQVSCNFGILLGDAIYESGVKDVNDSLFQTNFEKPYELFGRFDMWVAVGNHDWRGNVQAQISYTLKSDRWRMPDGFYAVPGLPSWLHLYALDTTPLAYMIPIKTNQWKEMDSYLCDKSGWKFGFGHHPARSYGKHGDNPFVKDNFKKVSKKCGVQAYFAGHDHDQQHIDVGYYQQFIQGAAGKRRSIEYTGDADQLFAASEYGFAMVTVSPASFLIRYFNAETEEIYRWSTSLANANSVY
jgi:tartrate-resistant acid phosphatase type 5